MNDIPPPEKTIEISHGYENVELINPWVNEIDAFIERLPPSMRDYLYLKLEQIRDEK